MRRASRHSPGVVPSPNIWHHTATYELENRATDPDGVVEAALLAVRGAADWSGLDVLDVGCGSGFHLPRFAASARRVAGVEPHAPLASLARRRTRSLANVTVLDGTAQALPLPDASVDVVHARLAYFFGPGCEPGLREVERVLRRGGTAYVLDNDASRSPWGRWFAAAHPGVDPQAVEAFWSRHGFTRVPLDVPWRFDSAADLEAVVRIELDPATADAALPDLLADQPPTGPVTVDVAMNLFHRTHS